MEIFQHLLSKLAGYLANCHFRWIKNWMITVFANHYQVNFTEAGKKNPCDYASFNEFFTRRLQPNARNIDLSSQVIVSPADGFVSEIGNIQAYTLLQAKNKTYTLSSLLTDHDLVSFFAEGSFLTAYLSPSSYHRVHMPFEGALKKMIYVPGTLFPVNEKSVQKNENLFARNERVICFFETSIGKMCVIFVGAFIVGSIETQWHGQVTPNVCRKITTWNYTDRSIYFKKGEEIGLFKLGSTVIMLFEKNKITWNENLKAGDPLKMGKKVGQIKNPL
ncbi:MAG: phosphatidylserine decarboxylase [Gammaproteobacteria bacterium RIFOXYB2_FULL_38_6]|nr:MAG: phosphatidylserine decarboxylase [Gammaproteobacteria bacterium RIFOXYB2_FULL_38_6]